jgi:hypothetical protein
MGWDLEFKLCIQCDIYYENSYFDCTFCEKKDICSDCVDWTDEDNAVPICNECYKKYRTSLEYYASKKKLWGF